MYQNLHTSHSYSHTGSQLWLGCFRPADASDEENSSDTSNILAFQDVESETTKGDMLGLDQAILDAQ